MVINKFNCKIGINILDKYIRKMCVIINNCLTSNK